MNRQEKLLIWVGEQHAGQLIRRTALPYIHHLVYVAETANVLPLGYETGLCHDLLEKTLNSSHTLFKELAGFGYPNLDASLITQSVVELTNIYTKAEYPGFSKTERKSREARRLMTIGPLAQTVKYADLIYNITWILTYDRRHASQYLESKRLLLQNLNQGDPALRQLALQMTATDLP